MVILDPRFSLGFLSIGATIRTAERFSVSRMRDFILQGPNLVTHTFFIQQ